MTNRSFTSSEDSSSSVHSPVAKALAGLATLAVAMGIGRFAFTPVLPLMLQDAGLTLKAGAWLASANYFGYLAGAMMAMFVRIKPEHAIRGGLLAITVVTFAMALPAPFPVWLLLRLLAGVSSAWVLISASAWCLEALAEYHRPILNSLVFTGVGTGIAAAGLLCIVLTQKHAGSASAWMALGLVAACVTVTIWRQFVPQTSSLTAQKPDDAIMFRWDVASIKLVCCYGIFGFGYIIPATFLPVMAKNALPDGSAFGWTWPLFGLAAALAPLFAAPLVQKIGNRRLWIVGQCIMALVVALPILSPTLPSIFVASLCVGSTLMVITLAALQEARRLAGRKAQTMIATMTTTFACGQIIGPLTINAAGNGNAGFSTGLMIAAILLAGSTLLLKNNTSQQLSP